MKNNWTLEDYRLVYDEKKRSWFGILILFLMILGVLIVLYKVKFQVYEKQNLIKNNNDFLLFIDSRRIGELESNNFIYIDHKKYKYDIKKISQDYTNVDGGIYQTIYINPYNYKTDSILTDCYFLKSEKSIFEMIIDFFKGGIG